MWTDFCQIGMNKYEFFFAGNLFRDNGAGSAGTMAWQVDKIAGYDGDSLLPVQNYGGGTGSFAMCPAAGSKSIFGTNMYMVASLNSPFSSAQTIWLHEITDTLGGNPQLTTYQLNTFPGYGLSPDGDQKDTNLKLDVRDCRVRSAYFHNDRIVFAMNTNAGGNSGIYLGQIEGLANPASAAVSGQALRIDSMDISFGGLSYGGKQNASTGALSSLVFFNFSSINHYPGNGALIVDENGTVSDPTILKYGFTYVDAGSSNPVRWGDYTTSDWRHSYAGEIWGAGYVGYNNSSHQHGTWISQIFIPNLPAVNLEPRTEPTTPSISVFPNPTTEFVEVEFDVPEMAIYSARFLDAAGKEIKLLVRDKLYQGKGKFTFYTDHLAEGLYLLEISKEGERVFVERVVVQR